MNLAERFALIEKPEGKCWLWKWAVNGAGRANFRGLSAPRKVYEMVHSCELPPSIGVLHSCDNPMCVNPAHLWLGTQKDNMRDCSKKGRRSPNSKQQPGERHSLAKLTWADVEEIRRKAAAGAFHHEIARDYAVQRRQISRIIRGERWPVEAAGQ